MRRKHSSNKSHNCRSVKEAKDTLEGSSIGENGYWLDTSGEPLKVSASDLERHAYCPISWKLAYHGFKGKGDAVEAGIKKHKQINEKMSSYKPLQILVNRETIIWEWWFAVIIAFIIYGLAFFFIDDDVIKPEEFAKYLTLLAVVWLFLALLAVYLPWRRWLHFDGELLSIKNQLEYYEQNMIGPVFQKENFEGGWFEGGRVEAGLLIGTIILGINSIGLFGAKNREQASFILVFIALFWTLLSTWQLQRVLMASDKAENAKEGTGLDDSMELAYSDSQSSKALLIDEESGLRGRPDQIVIIDGELVPVEQKTGKIPKKPHFSHKIQLLAYMKLVEKTTGKIPPYGIINYGLENPFEVSWDERNQSILNSQIAEVQRLMVHKDAKRNHDRPGKCQHCSRRHACDESLV